MRAKIVIHKRNGDKTEVPIVADISNLNDTAALFYRHHFQDVNGDAVIDVQSFLIGTRIFLMAEVAEIAFVEDQEPSALLSIERQLDKMELMLNGVNTKVDTMLSQTRDDLLLLVSRIDNLKDSINAYVTGNNASLDALKAELLAAVTGNNELEQLVTTSVDAMKMDVDEAFAAITATSPPAP